MGRRTGCAMRSGVEPKMLRDGIIVESQNLREIAFALPPADVTGDETGGVHRTEARDHLADLR